MKIGDKVIIKSTCKDFIIDCFRDYIGIIIDVGIFDQVIPGETEYKVHFPNSALPSPRTKDRFEFFILDELELREESYVM